MPKTTIFLGSSAAAKSQAKVIQKKFTSATLEFLPWWEAFTAGGTLLEKLDTIADSIDGAVLLFTPESQSTIRGGRVQLPNLNVLFEFGYFYGYLGRENVAMIKYGDFYLPSDFGGYIHIFGSTFFERGKVVQVGKRTTDDFERWVESW
jgi:predicted nucleotide-binding protein